MTSPYSFRVSWFSERGPYSLVTITSVLATHLYRDVHSWFNSATIERWPSLRQQLNQGSIEADGLICSWVASAYLYREWMYIYVAISVNSKNNNRPLLYSRKLRKILVLRLWLNSLPVQAFKIRNLSSRTLDTALKNMRQSERDNEYTPVQTFN